MSTGLNLKVSISFGVIELRLDLDGVAALRRPNEGAQCWRLVELGTAVRMSPSADGVRPQFLQDADGYRTTYQAHGVSTTVHHGLAVRPFIMQGSTLVVELGPKHHWPWCRNSSRVSAREKFARFRDEYNTRLRSAAEAQLALPQWAMELEMTPEHRDRLMRRAFL